jgi:hypothetical protein
MRRTVLIRLGGLAAVVGGIAATTLGLLYVLHARDVTLGFTEKALQKGHYETPVLTILLVGVLPAVATLHALQRGRYGSPGTLASLAAFVGLAMTVAAWFLAERVVPIALAGPVGIVCLVAASVGIVGLGLVTMNAGVLPRWRGPSQVSDTSGPDKPRASTTAPLGERESPAAPSPPGGR